MKYLFLTLNWVFGVLFSLAGVISLFIDPVPAIPLIAISLFLLPPVREYVSEKTGKSLSVKARLISILVLLVLFSVLTGISHHEKEKLLAEKKLQEQITRFKANKSIILEEIQLAYDNNNYQQVISETNKYLDLVSDDHELSEFNKLAKTKLEEIRKKERSQEILKELKTIPASKLEENKILYQELLSLYPDNPKYKTKFNYYSKKLADKMKKERLAAERKRITGSTLEYEEIGKQVGNNYISFFVYTPYKEKDKLNEIVAIYKNKYKGLRAMNIRFYGDKNHSPRNFKEAARSYPFQTASYFLNKSTGYEKLDISN